MMDLKFLHLQYEEGEKSFFLTEYDNAKYIS